MNQRKLDLQELKKIIQNQDKNSVELNICSYIETYKRDEEILLIICEIFKSNWHTRHEDIALSFQHIRNPITAPYLFENAFIQFDYDNWNDNFPMQRKCTWALADIGTKEAKEYLKQIELKANNTVSGFAKKRLINWDNEIPRKGQYIKNTIKHGFSITLEKYNDSINLLPKKGQKIIGSNLTKRNLKITNYDTGEYTEQYDEYIVVYQSYKKSIAEFAIENQKFGGNDFSFSRMSWIKPNFLWMMYRCGWAEKENQERVLAIWLKKESFIEILENSTFTSFKSDFFKTENDWREELTKKKVRLQWDPEHDYLGNKIERKAIQLGINGELLKKYSEEYIECILDITDFVKEQKLNIEQNKIDKLLIPKERIINWIPSKVEKQIGIN